MNATLVAPDPATLTRALVSRGVEPISAEATALGLQSVVLFLDDIDVESVQAISHAALEHRLECLTGESWAVIGGSVAKLGALCRPGFTRLPAEVAEAVGRSVASLIEPVDAWRIASGSVPLDRPVIAGILNVTPDSFSDGGRLDPEEAVEHAAAMVEDGASLVDIGAESTRPGRPEPVPVEEEWQRLGPVLERLAQRLPNTPVSVDTVKSEIARRALQSGAGAINDVSGLRLDPAIADCCAEARAGLILMHSRGDVSTMATYDHAVYSEVPAEVVSELRDARDVAIDRGVDSDSIVVDPGLGFSKTHEQTFEAFRHLPALSVLGHPIMVGPSRKRFLGAATDREVGERDVATAAACSAAYLLGAHIFRVHAVGPTRDALQVVAAVRGA